MWLCCRGDGGERVCAMERVSAVKVVCWSMAVLKVGLVVLRGVPLKASYPF